MCISASLFAASKSGLGHHVGGPHMCMHHHALSMPTPWTQCAPQPLPSLPSPLPLPPTLHPMRPRCLAAPRRAWTRPSSPARRPGTAPSPLHRRPPTRWVLCGQTHRSTHTHTLAAHCPLPGGCPAVFVCVCVRLDSVRVCVCLQTALRAPTCNVCAGCCCCRQVSVPVRLLTRSAPRPRPLLRRQRRHCLTRHSR